MLRRLGPLLLVLPLLLLPSCFTLALWGGEMEEDEEFNVETWSYETEVSPSPDFSNVRSWSDFFFCLALTPFTVLLDLATAPVQAWWFGWDDED